MVRRRVAAAAWQGLPAPTQAPRVGTCPCLWQQWVRVGRRTGAGGALRTPLDADARESRRGEVADCPRTADGGRSHSTTHQCHRRQEEPHDVPRPAWQQTLLCGTGCVTCIRDVTHCSPACPGSCGRVSTGFHEYLRRCVDAGHGTGRIDGCCPRTADSVQQRMTPVRGGC